MCRPSERRILCDLQTGHHPCHSIEDSYSLCRLRRLAQYLFIRADTSWRSLAPIDFRPRRSPPRREDGIEPSVRCRSSSTAIARSSFSFSMCKSWIAFLSSIALSGGGNAPRGRDDPGHPPRHGQPIQRPPKAVGTSSDRILPKLDTVSPKFCRLRVTPCIRQCPSATSAL